jgi:hypothetical protein
MSHAEEVITDSKRALIRQIYETLDMEGQFKEGLKVGARRGLEIGLQNYEKELTQKSDDPKFREEALRYRREFAKYVSEYLESRIDRELELAGLFENIVLPIWESTYSEEELKALLEFYKSPVGYKSIKAIPKSMEESTRRYVEIVNPRIFAMFQDAVKAAESALQGIRSQTD